MWMSRQPTEIGGQDRSEVICDDDKHALSRSGSKQYRAVVGRTTRAESKVMRR